VKPHDGSIASVLKRCRPLSWLVPLIAIGCARLGDDVFCSDGHCELTSEEWAQARKLAALGEPAPDLSNAYLPRQVIGWDPALKTQELAVVQLGQRFYFEKQFSGVPSNKDSADREVPSVRAKTGEPLNISCATCHDPIHAGGDVTSPGPVSAGGGWYDVNGQQTLNAAQYKLLYWNGRSDSLWSQAAAVMESPVSMNGNRLATVWTVATGSYKDAAGVEHLYRDDYNRIFADNIPSARPGQNAPRVFTQRLPLEGMDSPGNVKSLLKPDGVTCTPDPSTASGCPEGCRPIGNDMAGAPVCQPRFPLRGRPGGTAGCQLTGPDATGQYGDALDCMAAGDRTAVNQVYSNIVKAIAAYEWKLTSRDSVFDKFVRHEGTLPPGALRGLKVFVGRGSCIDCHSGGMLSDGKFHDIGVPQTGTNVPTEADCTQGNSKCDCVTPTSRSCLPWGVYSGLLTLQNPAKKAFRRDEAYSNDPTVDDELKSYYDRTIGAEAKGLWRTPSLRDVARTAPYMHDGFYKTLEDVVWHYDQGGTANGIGTKAIELRPLGLTAEERADLVEFLKTLTGAPGCTDFINDPACNQ
jgi:cytochrome c peroxidase